MKRIAMFNFYLTLSNFDAAVLYKHNQTGTQPDTKSEPCRIKEISKAFTPILNVQ